MRPGGGTVWEGGEKCQFKCTGCVGPSKIQSFYLKFSTLLGQTLSRTPVYWGVSYFLQPISPPMSPIKDWCPNSSSRSQREIPWRAGVQGETRLRKSPSSDLTLWPSPRHPDSLKEHLDLCIAIWVTRHMVGALRGWACESRQRSTVNWGRDRDKPWVPNSCSRTPAAWLYWVQPASVHRAII